MASARQSANFPLVPFSNRIADARLDWKGESFALEANFAPEPHAMHGLGWQRPWQMLQSTPHAAHMSLVHHRKANATGDWPFAFQCEQWFGLSKDALRITMRVTNVDTRVAPVGLGWHPYLVKRQGARIAFEAEGMWETDDQGLPLRRIAVPGLEAACDTLEINHVFDGVRHGATLSDGVLHVRVSSDLHMLVVSTHPSKDFVALEPVSHVTNAFNRPDDASLGTVALGPGESWSAQMTIEVRPAG